MEVTPFNHIISTGKKLSRGEIAERLRETIRLRGYSLRTEKAYLHWYEHFVCFHNLRHPTTMNTNEHVAASTQNQALSTLLFLYCDEVRRVLTHLPLLLQHAPQGTVPSTCPMPWNANTLTPIKNGDGNMSSPPAGFLWTLAVASCAVTTWTKAACKGPSARLHGRRILTSQSALIPFTTHLKAS